MNEFPVDQLVFGPDDVDLARSPLAGHLDRDTHVLGAFNPGLSRLANGNLVLLVRIAEALSQPVFDGHVHTIRWRDGGYGLDAWPLEGFDSADPRRVLVGDGPWTVMALTSLSWILPVELSPDGLTVLAVHYDKAIAPHADFQALGIEDPRLSRVAGRWLMTSCSVSPQRQSTTLYASDNGLDFTFVDMILDHQNKDMLIFEGLIDGQYWAQTRPLGELYFAYPPGSEWRSGPSINLATSPDARHWKPHLRPGIRPRTDGQARARIGGGAPPILTEDGWLSLWHGVEPNDGVGIYRTYWSLLDRDDPSRILRTGRASLLEPSAALTAPLEDRLYLRDVVFTTGIVDGGDHYVVASGEADLACRVTHVPKARFQAPFGEGA